MERPLRILISPLDWGLGHATRIVPLVRMLTESGCEVSLAASGATAALLAREFPALERLNLTGYRIRYPRDGRRFLPHLLLQAPRMLLAVMREHLWLRRLQPRRGWDLVISDNRYGLRHPGAFSVILTHQLNIRTGGSPWLDRIAARVNRFLLSRFDACLVPDTAEAPGLAGLLSHGDPPVHARYIGPLSRFGDPGGSDGAGILVMLSGPEPQRTILERMVASQACQLSEEVLVVRGLPEAATLPEPCPGVEWRNHLPSEALEAVLSASGGVVCRSGYSSVMDLVRLRRRAVLVPTPGQAEQEYLACHLSEAGTFPTMRQDAFDLPAAIRLLRSHPYVFPDISFDAFRTVLGELMRQARQKASP